VRRGERVNALALGIFALWIILQTTYGNLPARLGF
jgi:hypothetical protein